MDFLIELLLQFVVQVVGEIIFEAVWHGLAHAYRTRTGRYVLTAMVGVGFGAGWGWHLASQSHPPKLLWVSIALGVAALLLGRRQGGKYAGAVSPSGEAPWRQALAPPNLWPRERWTDFVVLNAAIAIGIIGGYCLG